MGADRATGEAILRLTPGGPGAAIAWWTVRVRGADGAWRTRVLPGAQRRLTVAAGGAPRPTRVVVTAVDRYGMESAPVDVR